MIADFLTDQAPLAAILASAGDPPGDTYSVGTVAGSQSDGRTKLLWINPAGAGIMRSLKLSLHELKSLGGWK